MEDEDVKCFASLEIWVAMRGLQRQRAKRGAPFGKDDEFGE